MVSRQSYTESGLFAQVKSEKGYKGNNSVMKGVLAVIVTIAVVGAAIYFL